MIVTAFIPARYASERLPGKPLKKIGNKPMVQWTYEACNKHPNINNTVVLTDDKRIYQEVIGFGGNCMMTSDQAENGTMRIAEVIDDYKTDIVLNIQGDEPGLSQAKLTRLIENIILPENDIVTLAAKILTPDILFDYNKVKVVFTKNNRALYFSRQAIPSVRNQSYSKWINETDYHLHLGIYGFKKHVFTKLVKLPVSNLEQAEKLEQLRWLQHGFSIYIGIVNDIMVEGIDTIEDLKKARKLYLTHYGR